ncbi:MAG: 50S ribosomal protein L6 [Rhodospirillales bacterium]|nr:50S ribosomal protein L6 [Rhodospirillales bacterium]
MSRIGKYPVPVPGGVTVDVKGQTVRVKGKLGELSFVVHDDVNVAMEDGKIRLSPRVETRQARTIWPTMRTRVNNLVLGVSEGYRQELEITGVGYRANLQGKDLVLSLGYSHEIRYPVPEGIKIEVEKPTALAISGIDKQKVGQVAAEIIAYRPPEPYKGKGIKRKGQRILRKEGKKK